MAFKSSMTLSITAQAALAIYNSSYKITQTSSSNIAIVLLQSNHIRLIIAIDTNMVFMIALRGEITIIIEQ